MAFAIELDAEQAPEEPFIFTRVHMNIKVVGRGLERGKVERAIDLAFKKYCCAVIMIGKTAVITHTLVVTDH